MIGDMNITKETGMRLTVSTVRQLVARRAVALLACALVAVVAPAAAGAVAPAPAWQLRAVTSPTDFSAGDSSIGGGDTYVLVATNVGGLASDGTPVVITGTPPSGVTFLGPSSQNEEWSCTQGGDSSFRCEDAFTPISVFGQAAELVVPVTVDPSVPADTSVSATFTVSGGGASSVSSSVSTVLNPSVSPAPFAVNELFSYPADAAGVADSQAADHLHSLSVGFEFSSEIWRVGEAFENSQADEYVRDIVVDLPPGFSGDLHAVPACPITALVKASGSGLGRESNCPLASQVGTVDINAHGFFEQSVRGGFFPETELIPVFNMGPEPGHPAELGTAYAGFPVLMYPTVVGSGADAHLRVIIPGIPATVNLAFQGTQLTLYGNPSAQDGGAASPDALLTNPSWCSGQPLTTTVYGDSYQHQGRRNADGSPDLSDPRWVRASTSTAATTGCGEMHFTPSLDVHPETTQADAPTGLGLDVKVPQNSAPEGLATPPLRNVRLVLPAGVSVSPPVADGLQACSDAQFDASSNSPSSCPAASQLGTVTATTPLLAAPLVGQLFAGSPECSPCSAVDAQSGRMVRLFMQIEGPGILLKFPGTASVDPATGQLTAVFKDLTQQPVSDVQVQLKGGPRAPLATPQACVQASTTSDLTPWSAPETPDGTPSSSFEVDWDGSGGACPAALPFSPGFNAGTVTPLAGAFSPFTLSFSRRDREQGLSGITVAMPAGLLGRIAGIALCGEPQAAQGSCDAASQIGTAQVAVGPGSHPLWVAGKVYLTGPYRGQPYGLSVVVPAVAGPYNLGNVVVRASIQVDPHSAALTVVSDPFPTVLAGVPLRLQTVNVTIDRPGFTFNPTNCARRQVAAAISSTQGASAGVSSPFEVGGCTGLPFHPSFTVSTQAKTSKKNGASLDVKVGYPTGAQANIRSVGVTLPKQLPSRLTTIQQACPEAAFNANPASCPAGSDIGTATAVTPVLANPVVGPAYLVSHGGAAFPDLVIILQGEGITLDLVGSIDIKKGVTSSTFASVPDAPIGTFELKLPEGPHSALAAVLPAKAKGSLCGASLTMPTTLTGQNGAQIKQNTKIAVSGCPKVKKRPKAKKHSRKTGKKKG